MGSVYEAVHSETHGKVALKVMLPRLVNREDMRRRFLQEAQVTARIHSDHIVRVFDAGIDETTGMPFIVMELLIGEDLDALLMRATRLDATAVIALLQQAALALDKTHAAGIVHRDLKPHNLFITHRDDGSPCVKILDFGIAKLIDDTGSGQRTRSAGTPMYMPPEQVRGEGDIGAAADTYALAHIAYTSLVGRPYWETEGMQLGLGPFLDRIFTGPQEPPSARALRDGVHLPHAFDAWFARAAAASKEMRLLPATYMIEQLAMVYGVSASGVSSIPLPSAPLAPMPQPVSPMTPASPTTGAIITEAQRAPGGAKPIWFLLGALVVLASVAVGGLVTYRIVASERIQAEDDDDRNSKNSKNSKKKKKRKTKAQCPFERCIDIAFDKKRPVEATKWLGKATKLARSMEPSSELVMISIGETIRGKVAPDASFSMVFMFRYPTPSGSPGEYSGLQIILNDEMIMGRRNAHPGLSAVPPPRCSTQQALEAVWKDGLDEDARVNIVYQITAKEPHWMVTSTRGSLTVKYVNAITCQVHSPF